MNLPHWLQAFTAVPLLTQRRIQLAYAIAIAADAFQVLLTSVFPLAALPFDEIIDVITALIIVRLIGFHILLFPTFMVEALPLVDVLPTWTLCVRTVIEQRKREQHFNASTPAPAPSEPTQ